MFSERGMMGNPWPHTLVKNHVPPYIGMRTYVVCGVQRGGTSMVSAVLRALGVNMGDGGFNHEDAAFLDFSNKLEDIVARRNVNPVWGLKVPEFALSLPKLSSILRCPVFILTFRNPVSVVDSAIVRGDADLGEGLRRIDTYYHAMLEFSQITHHPAILVSYERAATKPAQFVDEAILALGLSPSVEQRANALYCITGDGGGYTDLPARWHHLDVVNWTGNRRSIPILSLSGRFHDIDLLGVCDMTGYREVYFEVEPISDAPESDLWIQCLIDFGSGFDMTSTYNIKYRRDSAIRFRHEGGVERVALGIRSQNARVIRISVALSETTVNAVS